MAKVIFEVRRRAARKSPCDTIRVSADAYRAVESIMNALSSNEYSLQSVASQLILSAAKDYEIVEVD